MGRVSLKKSLWKGIRTALFGAIGAVAVAVADPKVAAAFAEAGPWGALVALTLTTAVTSGSDYVKRKVKE